MGQARTLGELKRNPPPGGTVKDEMRRNLLRKLAAGEPLFRGVLGYEETVIPRIVNAVLSRHNMILLGLRAQAKSRIVVAVGFEILVLLAPDDVTVNRATAPRLGTAR